ncbi:spartin [Raphidocelis subcapitata]|uniref:Spartin n=1 Tax=Raphidocelis subcapitata TaxID=307507 RepID=A0A2V0PKC7_9CHLO|nr:spartin [Raphidocelis subcapitata]|eukprot:GBF99472.1 spartin [Raphidocelis subcapitata]
MAPAELVVVPGAELHQVENGAQHQIDAGDFAIALDGEGSAQAVKARVGSTAWLLAQHLPALKAAPTVYSFGLEHTRAVYYCLVLPAGTPPDVLEAVEDVLRSSSALTTSRLVDAAQEQADRMAGGRAAREAEAIAAGVEAGVEAAPAAKPAAAGAAGGAAKPAAAVAEPGSAAATGYAGTPAAAPAAGPSAAAAAGAAATAAAVAGAAAAAAPPARRPPQQQPQPPQPAASMSERVVAGVATGLVSGSAVLAGAVKRASTALNDSITHYKERHIASCGPCQEPARVSPHLRASLKVVGAVASGAAWVTGKAAELLGDASYALALKIAKALPGHDARPAAAAGAGAAAGGAAAAGAGGELAPEERSAFKTIGAAGLTAYLNLYDALEDAAVTVVSHSADASAKYIEYKYGPEAGAAAAESVPIANQMVAAARNFTRLGARAVISGTAKRTAKIYLKSTMAGLHPDEQAAARREGSPARPGAAAAGGALAPAASR